MSYGDFGAVAAVVIALLSLWFSLWSFGRSARASVRPILIFERTTESNWTLHNVGTGPALDVLVGDQTWGDKKWVQVAQCHAIAAGSTITLPWLRHGCELAATYVDVEGHDYTSWCKAYKTAVSRGNQFSDWERTDFEFDLRSQLEAQG